MSLRKTVTSDIERSVKNIEDFWKQLKVWLQDWAEMVYIMQ